VVAAVLLGALLHAGWNAMLKSGADKALDTALMNLVAALLALPLLLLAGLPARAAWPFLAASLVIHVGYYAALTGAYRHGELGLTYPLMRGSAPVVVALASAAVFGEPLSALAWAGVVAVCCGVMVLGLSPQALHSPRALAFALGNAGIIAAYTVVDGLGVRAGGSALAYVAAFFVLDALPYGLLVLARRGRASVLAHARSRLPVAVPAAVATIASYGIALWAMTRAPVAMVAALRETSVLFAALLGAWLLKERLSPLRGVGIATILLGVAALRLG
jgi:phosphonate utilization associated putative membrane protein